MDLPNVKELEKMLKMLRKQGVTECNVGGISFKLGELPLSNSSTNNIAEPVDQLECFPEGILTPEQLAFYSAGGLPSDDPDNQVPQ
jgi:hypothetical protein